MKTLNIKLTGKNYSIFIGENILSYVSSFIKKNYERRKIVIITDENVEIHYGSAAYDVLKDSCKSLDFIVISPGESSKRLSVAEKIFENLAKLKVSRDDVIVTLGGGVVGDLGGFVASTYLRGIKYIQIPTTLLAQVDSSIGGKVAVDLNCGKNLVGSFYHPEAVFIDKSFLKTLKPRVLHDGLGEVIKYGCIRDSGIIEELLNYNNDEELIDNIDGILFTCCDIKRCIVELDELDRGDRMLLNFGHTLGHAIESFYNYEKYTHGEAVSIGMIEMVRSGVREGIVQKESYEKLLSVLTKYELPTDLPEINSEVILDTIAIDKKNNLNGINLIMLTTLGDSFIKNVGIEELKKIYNL